MDIDISRIDVEQYEAELTFGLTEMLATKGLVPVQSRVFLDTINEKLAATLEVTFLRKFYHKEESAIDCGPEDWWEAFKERWFPKSWLKNHPVRRAHKTVMTTFYKTCPHVAVNTSHDHFRWMSSKE